MVYERLQTPSLKRKRRRIAMGFALGVALVLAVQGVPQTPYSQFPSTNAHNGQEFPDAGTPFGRESNSPDQRRIQLLNAARQKEIVSDTEKLLKLAKELNDEMAQSEAGTMSPAQMHKVEEIGKLAKSVKEKMRYSVGGFPELNPPLTAQPGIQ